MGATRAPGRYDVMPAQCATCVFRTDGNAIDLKPGRVEQIKAYLINGTSHICHAGGHVRGSRGKGPRLACRGGRDWQLQIWHGMGILDAPTDEALEAKYREVMDGK